MCGVAAMVVHHFFWDPFGVEPSEEMQSRITEHLIPFDSFGFTVTELHVARVKLQHDHSSCGPWCLWIVYQMLRGAWPPPLFSGDSKHPIPLASGNGTSLSALDAHPESTVEGTRMRQFFIHCKRATRNNKWEFAPYFNALRQVDDTVAATLSDKEIHEFYQLPT